MKIWIGGVADESKNNLGLSFPLMMIKASGMHLLHALMMKRNRWSNGNKWAAHLKASIDNILAIEHKCRNSLSIKTRNIYKREEQLNPKVHTNTHLKITPSQFLSNNFLFFWLKYYSVFGKYHTSVFYFFPKLYHKFTLETRPITGSSIHWDEDLNC